MIRLGKSSYTRAGNVYLCIVVFALLCNNINKSQLAVQVFCASCVSGMVKQHTLCELELRNVEQHFVFIRFTAASLYVQLDSFLQGLKMVEKYLGPEMRYYGHQSQLWPALTQPIVTFMVVHIRLEHRLRCVYLHFNTGVDSVQKHKPP